MRRKEFLKKAVLCLLVFVVKTAFSQNDTKSTLIGNPNDHETATNIVADNVGNTYVAGSQNIEGLIVKQDAAHTTLWSKKLAFATYHIASIAFMDLVGDTLFGCGRFITPNNSSWGTFYFKLDAQTGAVYWVKNQMGSFGYFSCMRYANGKFILVGGINDLNASVIGGKVMAVSSQTGNLLWETPVLKYNLPSGSNGGWEPRTFFLHATKIVNGKMYITGSRNIYLLSVFHDVAVPLLIGIDENGNIFMEKYFDLPYTSTYNQFEGGKIHLDANQDLVITCVDAGLQTGDAILVKCDTGGNVQFCKYYTIDPSIIQSINLVALNEATNSYALYGGVSGPNFNGLYVMKLAKNGNFQKCIQISKPNVWIYSSYIKPIGYGNSLFLNGLNYFVTSETTYSNPYKADINQVIVDEDLNTSKDCSELVELTVTTTDVPVSTINLVRQTIPQTMTHQNDYLIQDAPFADYCENIFLNLHQSPGCDQSLLQADTVGFTDPTFYWSTGDTTSVNSITVTTTDTVFVRILDTKCCELIDTIVPQIISSSLTMSLPADTIICLQAGSSFTINPTFSGALGSVQYLWSNNTTSSFLEITGSGTYWLEISDQCLTRRDSIVVVVNSLPIISNATNMDVCETNFPATLNPVVSTGASILWDDGTTAANRTVNGPGSFTISATNDCGTTVANILVSQINLPQVQLSSTIDTCIQNGTMVVLVPTLIGVNNVLWSDGSAGNQLPVSTSGIYTVYGSNSCGIDSAICSVVINHFPELNLPAILDTCFEIGIGFSYTAQGSAGSYQWNSGSQSATEWISHEGVYSCTLTNGCGSITDSMLVHRMIVPDLYFPEDSIHKCLLQLAVSELQIETNYNLEILQPYHGTVEGYLTKPGWYKIHAFNGCWHKWDSIYVDLQNEQYFYLPNSFTPNSDSNNDHFEFKGENIVVREVRIFNRWGEEIFTESGKFTGWDGTYQGEECPVGIYAVRLIYEDCFGLPTEFNGYVNLIR